MTLQQVRNAMDSGRPFIIRMADGKSYRVPHPDYISIQPKGTFVVVFDDNDGAFVLPLLTMTGIAYDVNPTARVAEEK
ncbi:MAG: hypothetical protein ACKOD5_00795 [Chthoniobacterales bacterium]